MSALRITADLIAEVSRISGEWPDGVHTCEELQRLEPSRRPCTCGRCPATLTPTDGRP